MSGPDPNAPQPPEAATNRATSAQQQQQQQQPHQPESAPFQSQLQYLTQNQQQQIPQNVGQYGQQQPFDMGSLAGALPGQPPMTSRPYGSPDPSQGVSPPNPYQSPQAMFPPGQRGPQFADPAMLARAQQQQFMGAQYGGPNPMQNMPRQPGFPMQQQVPFSPVDPYAYGLNPAQYSPIDPRFGPPGTFVLPGGLSADISQFARRGSAADNAPVPNFPRGPPRKPKQSGHALWVGNLPPQALVTDLKDHFSRDATTDIESVFLIAKSNCAFVNYRTEAACVAAMNRFHDSRFHGVRLVCRLRRGTASSSATTPPGESNEPAPETAPAATIEKEDDALSPTIARSQSGQSDASSKSPAPAATPGEKVPEKYFIVKSLTAQDLEASVRNGIWATQSHNEETLNRAYDQADNVYLVFSANKSGEYFGYARMASTISGEAVDLSSTFPSAQEAATDPAGSPQSIPTPATATAPRGRIIDDSARGTIFWEADHSEDDEASPEKEGGGQNWGKQFQIEWVSTNRLPFYRTRGLRNPWNANREVKIARDGTELEPSVGRRLVQMFHRPSPSPASSSGPPTAAVPAGGMPFR